MTEDILPDDNVTHPVAQLVATATLEVTSAVTIPVTKAAPGAKDSTAEAGNGG